MSDRAEDPLDRLSSFVLDNGRRWGEVATDAQWDDAEAILDVGSDVRSHYLTRARGYSKTTDLAGIAMAVMITQAPAGAKLYACAADQDQARLILDSIEGFQRCTPSLQHAFSVGSSKATCNLNGATLTALAADAGSAFGLRPYLTIIDELSVWKQTQEAQKLFQALVTAAPKVNGRVAIITSAGDPATWPYTVLEHARQDPSWRVNEISGPPPWLDPAQLASQKALHPASVYARLFENRWVASEDRLTTRADIVACTTLSGPLVPVPRVEYVIGVDIGITNDRTAICICHAEKQTQAKDTLGLPLIVVDRVVTRSGTPAAPVDLSEVEELVHHLSRTFNHAKVVIDPTEAIQMAQRLRTQRGVRVEEFRFSSATVGELATTLYLLLRNHALALPDDESLFNELLNVRLRETAPNVYRLDHDSGQHDDQAIALALAANDLIKHPPDRGPRVRWVGAGPRHRRSCDATPRSSLHGSADTEALLGAIGKARLPSQHGQKLASNGAVKELGIRGLRDNNRLVAQQLRNDLEPQAPIQKIRRESPPQRVRRNTREVLTALRSSATLNVIRPSPGSTRTRHSAHISAVRDALHETVKILRLHRPAMLGR